MIINFRYHFFTITAIFAALGIGILIGSSIVGNEGLEKEQRRIVENINEEISHLKKENGNLTKGINTLETELYSLKSIDVEIYSLIIKEHLKKKEIILFYEELSEENLKEINSFFKLIEANLIVKKIEILEENLTGEISNSDYFISWNLKKKANEDLKKLKPDSLIIYQGKSLQGLILELIKEITKND